MSLVVGALEDDLLPDGARERLVWQHDAVDHHHLVLHLVVLACTHHTAAVTQAAHPTKRQPSGTLQRSKDAIDSEHLCLGACWAGLT